MPSNNIIKGKQVEGRTGGCKCESRNKHTPGVTGVRVCWKLGTSRVHVSNNNMGVKISNFEGTIESRQGGCNTAGHLTPLLYCCKPEADNTDGYRRLVS